MATKTANLHIRINPDLKERAEAYFDKTGVTMSQALEQFLSWTVRHQKTPMKLSKKAKAPDLSLMTKREIQAMLDEAEREVKNGKYYTVGEVQKEIAIKYGI